MKNDELKMVPVARFHSPFPTKFGIPKQSGMVEEIAGEIVFDPAFRNKDALRGMDEYDYLWLLWGFSANTHAAVSPVVRPPLLGGNKRVGVFASRSPYRPNPIGLSSVRLASIEWDTPHGPVIHVLGADLMNGTPIYDIKPYLGYADSHPGARSGISDQVCIRRLEVVIPDRIAGGFSHQQLQVLRHSLELDPRPHYQNDPQKVYGMPFEGRDIHFRVEGERLIVED